MWTRYGKVAVIIIVLLQAYIEDQGVEDSDVEYAVGGHGITSLQQNSRCCRWAAEVRVLCCPCCSQAGWDLG